MAERQRQIFIVRAEVLDANYSFNPLDNTYPKKFDSESSTYAEAEDRVMVCQYDATAAYDTVEAAMMTAIKNNTSRVIQRCSLETVSGQIIRHFEWGKIPSIVIPDPTPNAQPEPEGA